MLVRWLNRKRDSNNLEQDKESPAGSGAESSLSSSSCRPQGPLADSLLSHLEKWYSGQNNSTGNSNNGNEVTR